MNKRKTAIDVRDCTAEQRNNILTLLKGHGDELGLPDRIRLPEPMSSEVEKMAFTEEKPWLMYDPVEGMWVFGTEPKNRAGAHAICNYWQFRIRF